MNFNLNRDREQALEFIMNIQRLFFSQSGNGALEKSRWKTRCLNLDFFIDYSLFAYIYETGN